jgi:hypothetical protein
MVKHDPWVEHQLPGLVRKYGRTATLKILKKGTILHRSCDSLRSVSKFNPVTWYALEKGYGTSYGNIHRMYKLKKDIYLLNISHYRTRALTIRKIPKKDLYRYEQLVDPNTQYDGGASNREFHDMIKKHIESVNTGSKGRIHICGTYINQKEIDDDGLWGPTEVVLFGKQQLLVSETKK